MPSQIDATKPVIGNPTTQSVRDNFATARDEITALQATVMGAPFLQLAGGYLTGPLFLAGDPTSPMMAATKEYVDAAGGGGGGGIPDAPADGQTYGRVTGTWSPVLQIAGGTLTGLLTLSADPTANLHAATKHYVDTSPPLGGPYLPTAGGALTGPLVLAADPTAPLGAVTKQYSDLKLALTGGTLTGPLVLAADPTAPLQPASKQYTDAGDAAVAATAVGNVGRNLIHNGLFRVQQRGTGPWTTNVTYTADRWILQCGAGGSRTVQTAVMGDSARVQIGDEEANTFLQYAATGGAGAADLEVIAQRIENVRRLAGKTVTVSFWAQAPSGTPKLGLNITQIFGSGGSPSAAVIALATGASFTLSNTFTRYTATIAIPSVAGKTFGTTAGTDFTTVQFWLSAGANNNVQAGNIGVQSATVNIWGIQVEIGSVATSLEKPDPQQDLAKCQRFYQTGNLRLAGYGAASTNAFSGVTYLVQMRSVPTVTPNFTVQTNCAGTLNSTDASMMNLLAGVVALGMFTLQGSYTASADL
jgi:hypothetical protein